MPEPDDQTTVTTEDRIQKLFAEAPGSPLHPRKPRLVFDGRHLQVIHLPGKSSYALVSFQIMHAVADGRNAFASKLAAKNGIELWGVVPKAPNWYPAQETAEAMALIRAGLDRPALAYGASMGAYAALRWGRAAGCTAALAFSPQAHIDPAVTGKGDRRYARYHDPALHADMEIRPEHLTDFSCVLIDPRATLDLLQAALLPKTPQIKTINLHHMGHKTVGAIASSVVAQGVFLATLEGNADRIALQLRNNRKNTVSFHANLGRACLSAGRGRWALSILAAAHARFPEDGELTLTLAEAYFANGRIDEGLVIFRALVARYPQVPKYRFVMVRLMSQYGQADSTSELISLAESMKNFPIWLKVVKALLKEMRHEEAAHWHARTALEWPHLSHHLPKLPRRYQETGSSAVVQHKD